MFWQEYKLKSAVGVPKEVISRHKGPDVRGLLPLIFFSFLSLTEVMGQTYTVQLQSSQQKDERDTTESLSGQIEAAWNTWL